MAKVNVTKEFLEIWKSANISLKKQDKEELFYYPDEDILVKIEERTGREVRIRSYSNPTLFLKCVNDSHLVSFEQFCKDLSGLHAENTTTASGTHQESIMPASGKHQERIMQIPAGLDEKIRLLSLKDQARFIKSSNLFLKRLQRVSEKYYDPAIHVTKVHQAEAALLNAKIQEAVVKINNSMSPKNKQLPIMLYLITTKADEAATVCNMPVLKQITQELKEKAKKQEGIRIAQHEQREPVTYREIYKENKELVRLLLHSGFIRHSTKGHYRNFSSLPANMPQEIVNAVNNHKFKRRDNKQYTIRSLTTIKNAISVHLLEKQRKQKKIVAAMVVVFILLVLFVGFNRFANQKSGHIMIETAGFTSFISTEKNMDTTELKSFIQQYPLPRKINTPWRRNMLYQKLKNNCSRKNVSFKIDSINKLK